MKYRWLDTEEPVVSVGRGSAVKGRVGRILVLPVPRAIGNVLVDFGETQAVVPAGTLRRKQRDFELPAPSLARTLQENPNSCGGGHFVSGNDCFLGTQAEYEGGYVE